MSEARGDNALRKLNRMAKVLRHEEPDRVPISDFFWGRFLKRWRRELGLADDADIYRHYDLDWVVTTPNMDPWIRPFQTIRETADSRRFFAAGDNQIAGVGDGFQRNSPPWIETVRALRPDFPVYGSIIEASECLTRLVGQGNAMLWMGEEPGHPALVGGLQALPEAAREPRSRRTEGGDGRGLPRRTSGGPAFDRPRKDGVDSDTAKKRRRSCEDQSPSRSVFYGHWPLPSFWLPLGKPGAP